MKKFITCVLAALLALTMCMSFTACNNNNTGKEKLVVYTEAGFAPWEFKQKGSLDVVGVDMEIAKYIANKYGYELEVIDGSFDSIVAGISEDNALGIAGISYSAERANAVEFSKFYWGSAYQAVVYLKSSNPTLVDGSFAVSNFNGKGVTYQTGTTSQITVAEKETEWGISGKTDFQQVMAALQEVKTSGGNKYLIVDSQVAAQLATNDSDIAYAAIEGVEAEQYGVVAKKGNTALIEKVNAALDELLVKDADGKDQIEKWFVQYSAVEADE